MIEPWQVWSATVGDTDQPVVVVSSAHHLELTGGRRVTVVPLTYLNRNLRHHVQVKNAEGDTAFVMTDQVRTMSSVRLNGQQAAWTLQDTEQAEVRRALQHMVEF